MTSKGDKLAKEFFNYDYRSEKLEKARTQHSLQFIESMSSPPLLAGALMGITGVCKQVIKRRSKK